MSRRSRQLRALVSVDRATPRPSFRETAPLRVLVSVITAAPSSNAVITEE